MNTDPLVPAIILSGVVGGLAAVSGTCHGQTDDFDDNNDSGWTHFDPLGGGDFSVAGGEYRIRSAASPDPDVLGRTRVAALRQDIVYSDFCVVVDVVGYDEGLSQAIGIMARVEPNPSLGDTQGYTFTYQPKDNDVQISRITGEIPVAVAPAEVLSEAPWPGATLRMVFFGNGSYLEGRVYDASDLLNPLVVTGGTDATYPTGTCGLLVTDFSPNSDGPADATFDNYVANDGSAPQLLIAKDGSDGVALSWPDSALCWQLQSATTLVGGTWTDVTTGITHQESDGTFSLVSTFAIAGPRRYWRLRVPDGS